MQFRVAFYLLRNRAVRHALVAAVLFVVFAPLVVFAGAVSVLSQTAQACSGGLESEQAAGGGATAAASLAAQPLHLQPGRSYQVGATEYGGPSDPSSGSYGSIPDPSQSYLPAHPDTFAELSVLASNPANHGSFTFDDANALDRLPYLTALRVSRSGRSLVLYKRHRLRARAGADDPQWRTLSARSLVAIRARAWCQQGRSSHPACARRWNGLNPWTDCRR